MGWKTARTILYSLFCLIFSGFANLLGLGPEDVIARILGPEATASFVNYMVDIDANSARWLFVIVGNLATAMAFLFLFRIPQWKLEKELAELNEERKAQKASLSALNTKTDLILKSTPIALKAAREKELNAIRLHERTRKKLEKWRRDKVPEEDSSPG